MQNPLAKAVFAGLALATFSGFAETVTWGGLGGALDEAANWSPEQVPGAGDDVVFPSGATAVSTVTASEDLEWNKLTFSNASPLLFDLQGKTLVATNASPGGVMKLSAGVDVTLTNGLFRVRSMYETLGSTSTFKVAKDAQVVTDRFAVPRMSGSGIRILVDGGTLVVTNLNGLGYNDSVIFPSHSYNKAANHLVEVCNGGTLKAYGTKAIVPLSGTNNRIFVHDGGVWDTQGVGEFNFGTSIQGVGNEFVVSNATARLFTVYFGLLTGKYSARNCRFVIDNSSVYLGRSNGYDSRGFTFVSGYSTSNRLEIVNGSSYAHQKHDLNLAGRYDSLYVKDSTLNAEVRLDGAYNTAEQRGGTSKQAWYVYGVSNRVTLADGAYGVNGVTLGGTSNTIEVCDGPVTNSVLTLAGKNGLVLVRSGGTFTYWNGNMLKNLFNFSPGASNTVLRIEDGGAVRVHGTINISDNLVSAYNWTNCTDCAIEFTGRNPKMVFDGYSLNYQVLALGTADEEKLPDPVRLRFVVPETNFAEAPIRNEGDRDVWLFGNQPIEVVLEDDWRPREWVRVPLFYDVQGFRQTEMTAERVAKLNAQAILPRNAELGYDAESKTLFCQLKTSGLCLIVR